MFLLCADSNSTDQTAMQEQSDKRHNVSYFYVQSFNSLASLCSLQQTSLSLYSLIANQNIGFLMLWFNIQFEKNHTVYAEIYV